MVDVHCGIFYSNKKPWSDQRVHIATWGRSFNNNNMKIKIKMIIGKENIGRTLDNINQSKILYDPPPRIMEIKTKVNKWDLIKLKSFCTAKETINKVKRQPSEWEKIISNKTTWHTKIYKQLIQLNIRKSNYPIKKWEKRPNRHFSPKKTYRWLTNTW